MKAASLTERQITRAAPQAKTQSMKTTHSAVLPITVTMQETMPMTTNQIANVVPRSAQTAGLMVTAASR